MSSLTKYEYNKNNIEKNIKFLKSKYIESSSPNLKKAKILDFSLLKINENESSIKSTKKKHLINDIRLKNYSKKLKELKNKKTLMNLYKYNKNFGIKNKYLEYNEIINNLSKNFKWISKIFKDQKILIKNLQALKIKKIDLKNEI